MRCEVLLFAQLREAVGTDRITLELRTGATVADALAELCKAHKAIELMRGRIAVAVDEKYATATHPLKDGCTIALIPPVSGG